MIFHFLNGTSQQRAWFQEAVENSWATWADDPRAEERTNGFSSSYRDLAVRRLSSQIEVEWKLDPGPPGNAELGWTTTWHNGTGWQARIELHSRLDDPGFEFYEGKGFYLEAVLHELGHVIHGARLGEPQIQRICELFGGARAQWEIGDWQDQIKEATTEYLRDALGAPWNRRFPATERTRRRLQLSGQLGSASGGWGQLGGQPVEWLELLELFSEAEDPVSSDGAPLGTLGLDLESSGAPVDNFVPYVWRGTMTGVPFYGRFVGFQGNLQWAVAPQQPLTLVSQTARIYDADGVLLTTANRSHGSFNGGIGPYPFEWATNPAVIGLFEWDRQPFTFELEVRARSGNNFPVPEVASLVRINTQAGNPVWSPPVPWPITERALIPSDITAYAAGPGWRRRHERIFG